MSDLEGRVRHLQEQGRLPSIVAGIVRDGVVVDTATAGGTDVETSYRIGSITKTLTAVLVMRLRDEGLLALEDPLGAFVPESGYAATTIADLLGHTGGMQSEPVGPWWERHDGGDVAALIAANDGSGAVAGAGEYFHYSNLGYGLLGEVVARLRGASWWDVVQASLLDPLGMSRTTYGPEGAHAQGWSVGHFTGVLHREPHTDTGAMAPAGQLWSTLADLATWSTVLAGRRPEVLAASTATEMGTERDGSGYGLGLRLVDVDGVRRVGHTGSMPGFVASLFVDPATADATIALCNATTGLEADAVPAALLLGSPPEAEGWRPTTHLPAEVEPLLGVWFWGNQAVELRWNHDVLEVRALQSARLLYTFGLRDGQLVGLTGYHRGEKLHVHPTHLECATFVYTREPDVRP